MSRKMSQTRIKVTRKGCVEGAPPASKTSHDKGGGSALVSLTILAVERTASLKVCVGKIRGRPSTVYFFAQLSCLSRKPGPHFSLEI